MHEILRLLTPCVRLLPRSIVRVVGLGFREAEDRTNIQIESLFIAQAWLAAAVCYVLAVRA